MRYGLWLWILLTALRAPSQECTAYVIVDPFDVTTHMGIDGLATEDFDAKLGNTSLTIVSSSQSFNNRVLVMVQAAGSAEDPKVVKLASLIAGLARQTPAGRPVAFAVFGEHAVFSKGFATSLQERNAAIDDVMAQLNSLGKSPAVFDALHEGIGFFGQQQPGDTIVLISSSRDIKSRETIETWKKS